MHWYILIIPDSSCIMNTRWKIEKNRHLGYFKNQSNLIVNLCSIRAPVFSSIVLVLFCSYLIAFALIYSHYPRFVLYNEYKWKIEKNRHLRYFKNQSNLMVNLCSIRAPVFSSIVLVLFCSYLIAFALIYSHYPRFVLYNEYNNEKLKKIAIWRYFKNQSNLMVNLCSIRAPVFSSIVLVLFCSYLIAFALIYSHYPRFVLYNE